MVEFGRPVAPAQAWISKLRGKGNSADEFDWALGEMLAADPLKVWTREELAAAAKERGFGATLPQGPRQDYLTLDPVTGIPTSAVAANVQLEGERGAQGRLTRAVERDPSVGAAQKRTVITGKGRQVVVGHLKAIEDWWGRVQTILSQQEITRARAWYGDLHRLMAELFGEERAERMSLAWLLSQMNISPSGGMLSVLRADDVARDMKLIKRGGLNHDALVPVLRGGVPIGGYGAKLLDFIDSEMRRPVRTVMGDDPRGGQPALIDVWANRDVGKIDDRMLKWITETFGEKAAAKLKVDGNNITETDYEWASRFYNDLAAQLNAAGIDGGGWLPLEAQAVGWITMQKMLGEEPEFPEDLISKNSRTVSLGLAPSPGSEFAGLGDLSPQAAIRVIQHAARITHTHILETVLAGGAYHGDHEGVLQIRLFGSPEDRLDFAAVVGFASTQNEVILGCPMLSGNVAGVTLIQSAGQQLADPALAEEFWQQVREKMPPGAPIMAGYQMVSVDGKPALRVFRGTYNKIAKRMDWGPADWLQGQVEEFEAAVAAVAAEVGLDLDSHVHRFEVESAFNNWNRFPKGNGYRARLEERGRPALIGRLDDPELRVLPHEFRSSARGGGVGGGILSEPVKSYLAAAESLRVPGDEGGVAPRPRRKRAPAALPAPVGQFATRTELATTHQREIGASQIRSDYEAAIAFASLSTSAVERFDGLVLDKNDKVLAVVGGFKGGLASTNVYVPTIVGEAFMVPGAAKIGSRTTT